MPPRIPSKNLISDLRQVARQLGDTPTKKEYREYGEYGVSTLCRRFECWNDAVQEAGLDPNDHISNETLITDLRRVAREFENTPTYETYREYGNHAPVTVNRRFESWNNALEQAGLGINKSWDVDTVEILRDIVRESDGEIAPSQNDYDDTGKYGKYVAKDKFGTWWKAAVRAGLKPKTRRPLKPSEFKKFFDEVTDQSPGYSLPILLVMFSGMSPGTVVNLKLGWLRDKRDLNIVRVPAKHTDRDKPWLFRLPETWYNPCSDSQLQTHLPQTVEWVLETYSEGELPGEDRSSVVNERCLKTAQSAGIEDRETRDFEHFARQAEGIAEVPVIRPADLSYTHAVNLARRGVDIDTITQRLGADGFRQRFFAEDILLYLYQFEETTHRDYEPSGVYLDPNTGDSYTPDSEAD